MFNGIGALSAKLQSQAQATTPQVLMEQIFLRDISLHFTSRWSSSYQNNDSDEVMRAARLTTHFLWVTAG